MSNTDIAREINDMKQALTNVTNILNNRFGGLWLYIYLPAVFNFTQQESKALTYPKVWLMDYG